MSAIIRNPLTWILVTLGIVSGVGIAKTRTKRKKKKGSTKKERQQKYRKARKAYKAQARKRKSIPLRKTYGGGFIASRTLSREKRRQMVGAGKKRKGKRPSKATFSKMIRNNSRFTKAQKDRMIRNYRG